MLDAKTLSAGISAADWSRLGKLAKADPKALQSQYEAFVAGHPQDLRAIEVKRGAPQQAADCVTRDFSISLFKVLGLNGYVKFCGPADDWTATFHICLELFGSNVWCTDYTLSPSNASICYNVDLAAVKASFCVAIQGANHCFNIKGEGCYWAFTWHCKDFNETLFCFG
jgi:hypothetical protein